MIRSSSGATSIVAGLTFVLAMTQLVDAQQREGRRLRRPFGLVTSVRLVSLDPVQSELQLSDEQKAKIAEIGEKYRNDRRELFQGGSSEGFAERMEKMAQLTNEATASLNDVLDDAQRTRLRGIYIQVNEAAALANAQVAAALKINDDQQAKLEEVFAANMQAARDAFQDFRNMSAEERREKMTQLRREGNKKLMAVLTEEQQEQLQKMQGERIEIDRSLLFPRRGSS